MSDELMVSGGGVVAVGTSALFSDAERLEGLVGELDDCARDLAALVTVADYAAAASPGGLPGIGGGADAGLALLVRAAAAESGRAMDDARVLLQVAASRSDRLAAGLRLSADAYGAGESALAAVGERLAAELGTHAGFLVSTLGVLLGPLTVVGIGGAAGLALGIARAEAVGDSARPHGSGRVSAPGPVPSRAAPGPANQAASRPHGMLSDPRFVRLVRLSVMSADEFGTEASRFSPALVRALGDAGLGPTGPGGLAGAAGSVAAVGGSVGALRESPVRVAAVGTAAATPATGFADRAARVPRGASQIRIDRHIRPGEPDSFEVYLGGTLDFSPVAAREPWDLTSNVASLAGQESGAYRAVVAALEASGADARSPIVVTGYSAGGLVGAQLAASGDFDVRGLYTLGAPSGQVPVPDSVPWVAVEHTDDVVPALGGTLASQNAVLVRRRAIDDLPSTTGDLSSTPAAHFPAHEFVRYRETAELLDAAGEHRAEVAVTGFSLHGAVAGQVEITWYRASRGRVPAD